MNHTRVRYNAKARSKKKGKQATGTRNNLDDSEQHDSNALIHVPRTRDEKELDKKERLRQELVAASDSRMTSKRKKRLEKYIEKKLRKEEHVAVLQKLSQSQADPSSTLLLQSSSTLGTGVASTNEERLQKLEDREVRRAIRGHTGKRKRGAERFAAPSDSGTDEGDEDEEYPAPTVDDRAESFDIAGTGSTSEPTTKVQDFAVGSGLRKNADGTVATPKTSTEKRKTKQTVFQKWKRGGHPLSSEPEVQESDTSFDSSDSAYDSDEIGPTVATIEREATESGDDNEEPEIVSSNSKLGFKDWALKQLSAAKGYIPAPGVSTNSAHPTTITLSETPPVVKKRKVEVDPSKPREMRGPLGEDIQLPSTSFAQHVRIAAAQGERSSGAVQVNRPPDVEEARLLLPIVTEEQQIMETVLFNPVAIICGETGSGKTTQVPQFLYEAGYGHPESENPGMIGITQPRRVAAMSMASRVGYELSLTSSRVSYQIRYDATVSPSTSIKFMTDGVLLRELATDFLLSKYSLIIIDEAHERSINTDILIGVLSRVVKLRETLWMEGREGARPLRLIIMSATLRIDEFTENKLLFASTPPVINISARQHPVTIHFNRRTAADYVTEAIRKACKIHARLPPGGILIFLTGQNEITGVCRKLEAKHGRKALDERKKRRVQVQGFHLRPEEDAKDTRVVMSSQVDAEPEECDLGVAAQDDLAADVDDTDMDDPDALDSDEENEGDSELGIDVDESDSPMYVVPLYSLLPSDKQMKVFQPPPPGSRLVVVSTNIAETSLTIPGIRYVIDSGRAKERRYHLANGIQAFQISWISKASAAQRAGRAGRTGPGHCYRLYSSALFEHHFEAFSQPEILRMPIEGIILQMKSLNIDNVVNFPFPTPPDRKTLERAETVLTHLGAFTMPSSAIGNITSTIGGQITDLGKAMSLFPLSPRFSKMLVTGRQHGCLPYVIAIVSALSVGNPFLHEETLENEGTQADDDNEDAESRIQTSCANAKEVSRLRRKAFFESQHLHASLGNHSSDAFRLLSVVGAYEIAGGTRQFCDEHFVRPKAMEEIHKLRVQITNIVQANFPDADTGFIPNLAPPSELQLKTLRQLLAAGFIDQVAVRKDRVESSTGAQYATSKGVAYNALGIEEDVFIHSSSILANKKPPEYVVFHEVVRSTQAWLKGITVVNPAWLSTLGKPSLCTFSKPVKNSSGTVMVIPKFGPSGWELPPVKKA